MGHRSVKCHGALHGASGMTLGGIPQARLAHKSATLYIVERVVACREMTDVNRSHPVVTCRDVEAPAQVMAHAVAPVKRNHSSTSHVERTRGRCTFSMPVLALDPNEKHTTCVTVKSEL